MQIATQKICCSLQIESSFEYLFLNMVSVWLTCVSGGQKCMLEHARNVWISNKDR